MEFKYKPQHDCLDCSCPPSDLNGIEKTVYRWVHKNLDHKNDFVPPYAINPSRINSDASCEDKCAGYALSLFTTASKAEKKLKKLLKDKPALKEVFGNSIAEGTVGLNDGVADNPSNSGHFNFHEYKEVSLKEKFWFIKQLDLSV